MSFIHLSSLSYLTFGCKPDRHGIFYNAITGLKAEGYKVDAIEPQGAIYLSMKLDILGARTKDNKIINTVDDILSYLVSERKPY